MHSLSSLGPAEHQFSALGVSSGVLAALTRAGITTPTPIQAQAIPPALSGNDVIGVAQTGTGKTLAFGVPMLEHFAASKPGKALVLLPTRELAIQVEESLLAVGRAQGLRTAILIGGASMRPQLDAIRRNPDVIIATPGRLLDHLEQGTLRLSSVRLFVLDEADRMLDMGFWPQVKRIMASVPEERQTMLFSATLSKEIVDLARKHMKTPVSIEVAPPGTTAERVTQEFFIVPKHDKPRLLEKVLHEHTGSTIVFTRTKHGASRVLRAVQAMGHHGAEIHGNRSLNQRKDALEGFKKGKYRVLVATDIAARGIDVRGIALVVNYDLPTNSEDYVHRIGRTARAGADGHAISFAMPEERRDMRDIERLIRQPLRVTPLPELPPSRGTPHAERSYEEHRFSRERFSRAPRGFSGRSAGFPRRGGNSFARPASGNRSLRIATVPRRITRDAESEGKE